MNKKLEYLTQKNTGVCIGLDPDIDKLPSILRTSDPEKDIKYFLENIVDATAYVASECEIQKTFFDLYDTSSSLLQDIVEYIHQSVPKVPVIVDCKAGDINNTMTQYGKLIFDKLGADAIVVNPYMGDDVFAGLEKYSDKGIAVLVRTSNKGASDVQDVLLADGNPLWKHMFDLVVNKWNPYGNMIPVLSGHANLEGLRNEMPDSMPVLYAGVGKQGGNLRGINYLVNSNNSEVIVNSSRGILYGSNIDDPQWKNSVKDRALELEQEIRRELIG